MPSPPSEMTALEAAGAIRAGQLSSLELVEACLARIAEREDVVGAWQCVDADGAREAAARCDRQAPRGALHGVPVGIKDIIDTETLPTERGSAVFKDRRPSRDATCVDLLRQAGAIVLGKTVTTEVAYFHPGKTVNPHRPAHTPGGSSSGSAAAVADRMVPVALGTQTAGSINRPASYCGVVGYKPTHGDFSLAGVMPFAPSLDTLGTLTRSVADAVLLRSLLLGRPPVPDAVPDPPSPLLPRIALCRTPWWTDLDPAVQEGLYVVAGHLARGGAEVAEIMLPTGFAALVDAQKTVMAHEAAASLGAEVDRHGEAFSAALRRIVAEGRTISRPRYLEALRQAEECRRDLGATFSSHDLLLTPASSGEAPEGLDATGDPLHSRSWTLLGLPTLTLPALRGPTGLPLGVQCVADAGQDERLLGAGAFIERCLAEGT